MTTSVKNQEWLLNSDSDSDSDPYEDGDEGTDAFLDQMEMLEVSIMIQKIYRGYRQRIKYKKQLHLCRAWTRHGFPQYDLEIADIIIGFSEKSRMLHRKATMIQKIYRGFRKRISHPGRPHLKQVFLLQVRQ